MRLHLFVQSQDFYLLPQNISVSNSEFNSHKVTIITPNPALADEVRSNLEFANAAQLEQPIEIITIAKFIQDEIKVYGGRLSQEKYLTKEELLILLGTVWKQYIGDNFENFMRAYLLFTELRSSTLYWDVVVEIIEDFEENIQKAINLFWMLLEEGQFIDEQKAYELLAQKYKEKNTKLHHSVIIWGFEHLSANQIDFINALDYCYYLEIPYSQMVYAHVHPQDWISWLQFSETIHYPVAGKNENFQSKVIVYPSHNLAPYLAQYCGQYSGPQDILLLSKEIDYSHISEISLSDLSFKCATDIFQDEVNLVFNDIHKQFEQKSGAYLSLQNVLESIHQKILNLYEDVLNIKGQQYIDRLHNYPFTLLKVLCMGHHLLQIWSEHAEENHKLSLFDLKILQYVMHLKLPRIYKISLPDGHLPKTNSREIKSFFEIHHISSEKNFLICIPASFESMKSPQGIKTPKLMHKLAIIGPIPRGEYANVLMKEKIYQLATHKNIFFIEKGALEKNFLLKEIFSELNLQQMQIDLPPTINFAYDPHLDLSDFYLNQFKSVQEDRLSPQKIQTFMDCPRKFHMQYVQRLQSTVEIDEELQKFELGRIEHLVIQNYLQKYETWNEQKHKQVVEETIHFYLQEKKSALSSYNYEIYRHEIANFSRNGILYLMRFKEVYPTVHFEFEREIYIFDQDHSAQKGIHLRGRVDCIAYFPDGPGIIDFKRSTYSIPSWQEFKSMDSIQIWFYLAHLPLHGQKVKFWGYCNLQDPQKSSFLTTDSAFWEDLKMHKVAFEQMQLYENVDYEQLLEKYADKEKLIITSIIEERLFRPLPRKESVCDYCYIKNICSRN